VERAKVTSERAGATVGADESVERDLADAQVPAPERLQSPLDLVELEQSVTTATPQSFHLETKPTTANVGRWAQLGSNIETRLCSVRAGF
jgi:hypothetical protein